MRDVAELLELLHTYLTHVQSGKVRESFRILGTGRHIYRLVFVTDRISIFDFVLGCAIPGKGEVLNGMNIFWFLYLGGAIPGLRQDIVAYGSAVDHYLPPELRGIPELQRRAIIVEEYETVKIELVSRYYLLGSAWEAYADPKQRRMVCGQELPAGLREGERLGYLFTPTTKAPDGEHDAPIPVQEVRARYGMALEEFDRRIYGCAQALAAERSVIIADKKCEVGIDPRTHEFVLLDERFTSDSSRFWRERDYASQWPAGIPGFLDKEKTRIWGRSLGINKRDPRRPEDRAWVRAQIPSPEVVAGTIEGYAEAFTRFALMPLAEFQRDVMRVNP